MHPWQFAVTRDDVNRAAMTAFVECQHGIDCGQTRSDQEHRCVPIQRVECRPGPCRHRFEARIRRQRIFRRRMPQCKDEPIGVDADAIFHRNPRTGTRKFHARCRTSIVIERNLGSGVE